MQRAQRGIDNHAVDIAVTVANLLELPLRRLLRRHLQLPSRQPSPLRLPQPGPRRHRARPAPRNITFLMRRSPHESHEQVLADVRAALLIGDENPMRMPEQWRKQLASRISIPFWTVDADVVIPAKLIEKAQYGAYTIRPRLYRLLPDYLHPYENPHPEPRVEAPSQTSNPTLCTRTSPAAGRTSTAASPP